MADISKITLPNNEQYNLKDAKAFSCIRGIAIPENADLNDYKTPGNYYIATASIAATITVGGSPLPYSSNTSYRLTVLQGGGSGIIQILQVTGYAACATYIRLYISSTWYAWQQIVRSGMSGASLVSPSLTGTPTAPTASAGTNNTQIATTAFAQTAAENIVKTFVRPNLIDGNWYFIGGGSQLGDGIFPINQRGQQSYELGSGQYGIDRWRASGSGLTESLQSDGVVFGVNGQTANRWFRYAMPTTLPAGKYTFSVLVTEITVPETGDSVSIGIGRGASGFAERVQISEPGFYTFTVESSEVNSILISFIGGKDATIKIAAMKLELGGTQTLAHQESGEWVLNELPNWDEELQKCQKYLQWIPSPYSGNFAPIGSGICWNATTVRIALSLSVPMISTPTVTVQNANTRIYLVGGSGSIVPSAIIARTSSYNNANLRNILCLECTIEGGTSMVQAIFMISGTDNPGGILLSCED